MFVTPSTYIIPSPLVLTDHGTFCCSTILLIHHYFSGSQSVKDKHTRLLSDFQRANIAFAKALLEKVSAWVVLLLAFGFVVFLSASLRWAFPLKKKNVPISVNYHFTRQCNKSCGFCFHTATTSYKQPEHDAKRGLALLKTAGMRKINFAGGEPFLYPRFLGSMLAFCKGELGLESVSIVTNGSLVEESFLRSWGQYIDILAVSCDSADEQTNIAIGRGSGNQVPKLIRIAQWCQAFGIKFKLNTVVCRLNYLEDMTPLVQQVQPFRWKCFQVLLVAGENDSDQTLRDVRKFQISDKQFQQFCHRHQHLSCFVAEPNNLMAKSYLILDEYMRFLDRDGKQPSSSILEVGVSAALAQVYWDQDSFVERGGIYDWSREGANTGCKKDDHGPLEW